jgi:hypothetical protein
MASLQPFLAAMAELGAVPFSDPAWSLVTPATSSDTAPAFSSLDFGVLLCLSPYRIPFLWLHFYRESPSILSFCSSLRSTTPTSTLAPSPTPATVHACRFLETTAPGSFGTGTPTKPPAGRAAPELDWDHISAFCDALLSTDVEDQATLAVFAQRGDTAVPLPALTMEQAAKTVFAWRHTRVGPLWRPVSVSVASVSSSQDDPFMDSSHPAASTVPADSTRRDAHVQQIERVHARVVQETTGTPEECGWTYKHTLKEVVIHTKVVNGVTISRGTAPCIPRQSRTSAFSCVALKP